jgi:hypothetical protein
MLSGAILNSYCIVLCEKNKENRDRSLYISMHLSKFFGTLQRVHKNVSQTVLLASCVILVSNFMAAFESLLQAVQA